MQFSDASKSNIQRFIVKPKPLNNRITIEGIKNNNNKKKNKAAGSDEIQMKQIDYSTGCILIEIYNSLNNILKNHFNEINFDI